ncbi:hypothetical protein A3G55_02925 [Candidatus Giovannonibacteria bacterium RIFCSPLOWO2_12_FULL_44_25]|nr:MAG: hypothetical protein A2120_01140 [Candidatus Giovannonibacteria bacterium GWA2_45_15]OGF60078.1 MAG: hypothetical protein A2W40_02670 [Candidatus Giovannonibacteria bacterium RIFCSPHIGHO2_01_45_12]OGF60239.1 MAG: hypothetical protein A2656_00215 [Candidatus Giovannonibacteria bacterium RIFCSPHIGHO2_01_FULL_44_100]OGF72475.1 MAG: hypothetical protein A3C05_04540 [Candidatus Giovannonibacteria bacterium RIFCSPHIGHO2_02_FULL_45_40]OGF83528.1 MAG: hypothetical protein A3E63_00050 [Candidatu
MDTVSRKKRSETMKAIKSSDTLLEKSFRRILTKAGYKYKKNIARLAGKPDIVFPKQRVVIFLDSCFWHGCRRHCRFPNSNRVYWKNKIGRNKKRDKIVNRLYKNKEWKLLRFWEHKIKKNPEKIIAKLKSALE